MSQLNGKQELFVQEYLVDLNAAAAARRAGYSTRTAKEAGAENLAKPHVQAAIQDAMAARAARTLVDVDRVLQELLSLLECCTGQRKVRKTLIHRGEVLGEAEVYIYDPAGANGALDKLGRHLAMYTDRVEAKVAVERLTDEELEAAIATAAAKIGYKKG